MDSVQRLRNLDLITISVLNSGSEAQLGPKPRKKPINMHHAKAPASSSHKNGVRTEEALAENKRKKRRLSDVVVLDEIEEEKRNLKKVNGTKADDNSKTFICRMIASECRRAATKGNPEVLRLLCEIQKDTVLCRTVEEARIKLTESICDHAKSKNDVPCISVILSRILELSYSNNFSVDLDSKPKQEPQVIEIDDS